MNNKDGISIIVPFFNEEEMLPYFCKSINTYVKELPFSVELVFVNDGSTDGSLKVLSNFKFCDNISAKVVDFTKNFGSHAAIRAGILNSSFEICTWLAADLQEPLEIISLAYQKIKSGECEIVCFTRRTVEISKTARFFSKLYYRLMQRYAVKSYSENGNANIAFGNKVKQILNKNIESNSSIVMQIMDLGFKSETIELDYGAREQGKSKWTMSKKIKMVIDSFVSFSYMPIRFVSIIGILVFFVGVILGIQTIINKLTNPNVSAGYSTIVCVLTLGFGITNISIGIIAEYLWRTMDIVRKRPVFVISDIYDLSHNNN